MPWRPIFDGEKYVAESEANGFATGEGAGWAFAFVEDGKGFGESYANLIPTPAGGTHESGLREGIFEAIKAFAEYHNLTPKGIKLLAEDAWSRTIYFLSAKVLEPQFHGQTKEKLSNRDAVKLVTEMVRDPFALWMNSNVEHGRKITDLVIRQAIERSRTVQKVERKKSSSVVILPEKLSDCESTDLGDNELYPRRGRLGRRLGEAGARQALPGDLPHARQGAELVGSEARAAVLQRRDPRHLGRPRRGSARRRTTSPTCRGCATARSPR